MQNFLNRDFLVADFMNDDLLIADYFCVRFF